MEVVQASILSIVNGDVEFGLTVAVDVLDGDFNCGRGS